MKKCILFAMSCATWVMAAHAAQHAHVHGEIQLGVAIEGMTVTVDIDTPLESLIGFEHPPHSAQEMALSRQWADAVKQPAGLLKFNPEAACSLKQADLDAAVLGLGKAHQQAPDGHADLEGNWTFECRHPDALRALDLGFFERSPHAQRIEVRLITAQGQRKLSLKRPLARIPLAQ
ncbi:MAG: DUF2796 domain-containing protein [Aquabacterium sp.]